MSRRPLWQYLLFHWARAVLGGLMALAVVAALLRSFSPFSFAVWCIVGAALGTVFISPRRWRRGQSVQAVLRASHAIGRAEPGAHPHGISSLAERARKARAHHLARR